MVGSGPAGFYAAGQLTANDPPFEVDLIERLPTPWGLVRLGVAPDHPEIKSVSRVFEKIAKRPGFRFFGNVEVGRDVRPAELARLYDAVVYAVGAQTDRRMDIPGEDIPVVARDGLRRLVQRPPRLPDARLRPLGRTRRRGRKRQRRHGRRPNARADALGARADRRDGSGDRRDRELRDPRDRRARPARPAAGRLHEPRAQGARRARRARRSLSMRASSPRRARIPALPPRRRILRAAQFRSPDRVRCARTPGQTDQPGASLLRLAGRDPRRRARGGRGGRAQPAGRRRSRRAPRRPDLASGRRCPAASCCAASATAVSSSPGCPSTTSAE